MFRVVYSVSFLVIFLLFLPRHFLVAIGIVVSLLFLLHVVVFLLFSLFAFFCVLVLSFCPL